jgi:hypothetical protein
VAGECVELHIPPDSGAAIADAPLDAIGSLRVRRSGGRILQLEHEVVGVAVVPALTGLERADDGVTRRVVVSCGVLSR